MSNNDQPNKDDSSNISPMFTFTSSSVTATLPPAAAAAAFYQSYMQAATMYAFHQQFFQHMFSVPPPPLPTTNISARPSNSIQSSVFIDNAQRKSSGEIFLL